MINKKWLIKLSEPIRLPKIKVKGKDASRQREGDKAQTCQPQTQRADGDGQPKKEGYQGHRQRRGTKHNIQPQPIRADKTDRTEPANEKRNRRAKPPKPKNGSKPGDKTGRRNKKRRQRQLTTERVNYQKQKKVTR